MNAAAAGEPYEGRLTAHCTLGFELEIGAKNRESANARIEFKSGNVVSNSCGATSTLGLYVLQVDNKVNHSQNGWICKVSNREWGLEA